MKPLSRVAFQPSQPPAWVAQYVGIPFVDLGRDKEGCDCFGLVRMIFRDCVGIDINNYQCSQHQHLLIRDSIEAEIKRNHWQPIEHGNERCFDVAEILMPVPFDGKFVFRAIHIGIIVERGWLLHTEQSTGSALLSPTSHVWRRIQRFWRHQWIDYA